MSLPRAFFLSFRASEILCRIRDGVDIPRGYFVLVLILASHPDSMMLQHRGDIYLELTL